MYKLIKVGDFANIQFKEYLFNSYADMINFDTNLLNFADKATIVEDGTNYTFNSSKNWILQSSSNSGDTDLSDYYTKEEVNDLIDGETAELLEIKLPLYGHVATEIPTSINLDESSWDNVISVNTDMNNGEYPNVLLTFFAGDTGFNIEIGTTIYQTVVKPRQFIVEIDNENVGMFTLDVTMVDGVQISIIADDLTSADRTVTFIQKKFCSQEDLSTAIGDINSLLDTINGEVIEIETGGGSEPTTGDYLVQFIGYRGEVYQTGRYSTGDVVSFPSNPSHDGLVFQGWSSPISFSDNQVTVTNQDLTIGAMFTTASGKTEIDIDLTNITGTTVTLQDITNVTLIEWGDGTTSTELGSHTYDSIGEYTILISGDNMTLDGYIFGQSSSVKNYWCVEVRLNGVTNIGSRAFQGCSSLTSITIPDGVTSIGSYAFQGCSSLTSITIPDGVTSIGNYAFYCGYSLTSITIPNSVTSIENSAFDSCSSLTSITIPDGVGSIGDYAFFNCSSLTSITIPDGVTSIGDEAFEYCYSLTSITIPDGVTSIDFRAFYYCSSLTSITIPDSVTSIGSCAFMNCYSLTSYDFTAYTSTDTVPTLSDTNVFGSINNRCKMYFSDQATLDNFANATNWSTYADYMYVREVTE